MRRFAILFVLFLYVIPSVGFTFSAHYCMGELSGISFSSSEQKKCPCGSQMTKKSCCKDQVFSLKLTDQQNKVTSVQVKLPIVEGYPVVFRQTYFIRQIPVPDAQFSVYFEDPPKRLKQPIYLLNEVFRI